MNLDNLILKEEGYYIDINTNDEFMTIWKFKKLYDINKNNTEQNFSEAHLLKKYRVIKVPIISYDDDEVYIYNVLDLKKYYLREEDIRVYDINSRLIVRDVNLDTTKLLMEEMGCANTFWITIDSLRLCSYEGELVKSYIQHSGKVNYPDEPIWKDAEKISLTSNCSWEESTEKIEVFPFGEKFKFIPNKFLVINKELITDYPINLYKYKFLIEDPIVSLVDVSFEDGKWIIINENDIFPEYNI